MKNLFFALFLITGFLMSCGGSGTTTDPSITTDSTATTTVTENTTPTPDANTYTVKAKFVEFVLADASHFTFEDEKGVTVDFGGCEAKNFKFERELSEKEANSENQGWGSNTELQGKWFMLTCTKREMPEYQDGPMGMVDIILEAAAL